MFSSPVLCRCFQQEMQMQRASSFGINKRPFDSDLEFRPPTLMQPASFGNNKKRPIDSDLEFQPPKQTQHTSFGNNKKRPFDFFFICVLCTYYIFFLLFAVNGLVNTDQQVYLGAPTESLLCHGDMMHSSPKHHHHLLFASKHCGRGL